MLDDLRTALARKKRALLFLPVVGIAVLFVGQLLAVSRYRLDYPINDDWRYYKHLYSMPELLNFEWLFRPAMDTIHVTGKFLDWLVFQNLSHDYGLLATLSFGLFFGSWVLALVVLLRRLSRDRPVILLSSLLVLYLAMAGSPYWVTMSSYQWLEPVIAYHQMLPVLGLTLLGLVFVLDRTRWPRGWAYVLAFVLTVFFSLVYSSGAVLLVAFGAVVLAGSEITRRVRGELPNSARGLAGIVFVTGAVCLALHVLLPLQMHDVNPMVEAARRGGDLAPPNEAIFWRFFIGLFDRAVLSTAMGWVPDLRGSLVALVFVVPMLWLPVLVVRNRTSAELRTAAIVLIAALAAVLAYALLLSYGRAGFGGVYLRETDELTRPALYARSRFFFWWITAFLPLAVVAWGFALEQTFSRRTAVVIVPILALLLVLPKTPDPANGNTYFENWSYSALYQRDANELRLLIDADRIAIRTGRRNDREARWNRRLGRSAGEMIGKAAQSTATFVDRWNLLPKKRPRKRRP